MTPREAIKAKNFTYWIKNDQVIESENVTMSEWIAMRLKMQLDQLPFKEFFGAQIALVPVPRSSLMQRNSLWVPDRMVNAMHKQGLGEAMPALERIMPVQKSSSSPANERPLPKDHFDPTRVQTNLTAPEQITLVDDVITRGHTMLGAAWRLHEAFPDSRIMSFAAMRTVSQEDEFWDLMEPVKGKISYRYDREDALRRP